MKTSIKVDLQRIVKERKEVFVPISDAVMRHNADGTASLDSEKIFELALALGKESSGGWRIEESQISIHPIQRPIEQNS